MDTLAGLISGLTSTLSGSVLNSNLVNLGNIQVGNYASAASDMIGVSGGGLLTALSGPATAGADIGGLGTALAGDFDPVARPAGVGGERHGRSAGIGLGRRWVVDRWHVGAARLGRARRDPGGKHARHAGVAELGRGARPEVDRVSGHHRRMPAVANGGRGRLELRSPALRRQAQGHAGDCQADQLTTLSASVGRHTTKRTHTT